MDDQYQFQTLYIVSAILFLIIGGFAIAYFQYWKKQQQGKVDTTGKEILDIFIYGHSASGKSTLIQRLFFLGNAPIQSTVNFDIYEFEKPYDLNTNQKIKIRIADYRGQNPSQLLKAVENHQTIDCLLFVADVAPAYSPTMRKYSESEILGVLAKNRDVDKNIQDRVKDHEAYLSKYLLQIIFQFAMNDYLKSVYFLINKVDVLDELKNLGFINTDVNTEEYARSFYLETINEIQTFCSHNTIPNFQVQCISASQHKNIHEILNNIVSTFISNKNSHGRVQSNRL